MFHDAAAADFHRGNHLLFVGVKEYFVGFAFFGTFLIVSNRRLGSLLVLVGY